LNRERSSEDKVCRSDRINNAGAGVTASYDSSLDKIVLTGTSAGESIINVSNDTTGFLTAAGLNGNNTILGNLRDDQQALSGTAAFAGVTSRSFKVNGISISVDAQNDTILNVIERINSSGAGVTAGYDAASDKLSFTPNVAGSTLSLGEETYAGQPAYKIQAVSKDRTNLAATASESALLVEIQPLTG